MAFCTNCGASVNSEFCTKCGSRVGFPTTDTQPVPSTPVVPPIPQTTAPPGSKKQSPLIWILVGCGGLIVIAGILAVSTGMFVAFKAKQAGFDPALMQKNPGLAVAKIMASINPDVEVLSVDEDRGIISVRDKKTGKTLTINLEEAKKGKIVFQDEKNQKVEIQSKGEGDAASLEVRGPDGVMKMGATAAQLPDFLPAYPGAEGKGTFGMSTKQGQAGSFSFKTSDSVEAVASFYEDALKKNGFEVQRTEVKAQVTMIMLICKDGSSKRNVHVTAARDGEETTVSLTFEITD